jgi:hypothetical protein
MSGRDSNFARYSSLIAVWFCVFTFARTIRPIESLSFNPQPSVATKYQKLTRHTLEEVSSRSPDVRASVAFGFSYSTPQIQLSRPRPGRAVMRTWPIRCGFVQRRIPPPTSDDAH